ncbi:MAG: DNA polymerase III subunit gamma/tau [Bacilli bacterium]|jgi:DNA polymerase-3 subunit gamma/tau|nr:DNA polymerase III subunit gamma/tau [Bacilli bacterium]
MAYRALYRTYRPKTFKEVVGQKPIVTTLQNALKDGKIAHAYLFCGPRGTGKTTMARLFAKALNCSKGIGEECNQCENCMDILEGKHPDVYEIDAASNSGVDNVRKLIEQVSFAPILGRYKVYIIDEVHSMTGAAFNALLKTLEEPPANVVFILATTEPDEVLPTILSRVQRFDFSKVSEQDLIMNMEKILEKEGVSYEEEALQIIARLAQGGVRDSLSLLDQAISYGGDKVTAEDVDTLFGLMKISDELELVKAIHLNDVKGAMAILKDKYAKGADVLKLHDDLTNIYKDLLVFGTTRDQSLLTYLKPDEALKTLVTPSEIRRNLSVLIKARRDYKTALNAFDQFELTLLSLTIKEQFEENEPERIEKAPEIKTIPLSEIKTPAPSVPVQTPSTVVVEEKKAEEVSKPTTITTSSLDRFDQLPESGEGLTITKDQIINIMVQGNKSIKQDILKDWETKLKSVPNSDSLSYLASQLMRCTPCIAAPGVLVVKSFFKGVVGTINLYSNVEKTKQLTKKLFNMELRVVGIENGPYIDFVNAFMNLSQADDLPSPTPIDLPDGSKKDVAPAGPTNAEKFMDSLGLNPSGNKQ